MDNFIAGFAYGTTTVIVGQPLDTIKTRMQALGTSSALMTAKTIVLNDGIRGLYRGGSVLVLGGSLIRSTQFGVYENVLLHLRQYKGSTDKKDKIFGLFDPQVIIAGFAGGVGRGLVEGPFEYIKTRRQVEGEWHLKELFSGSSATILRNSFLFSSFVIYMDVGQQLVPGGMGPFWSGALCSNLAWLTVWPLDVVKSQMQSGLFHDKSIMSLVRHNLVHGVFYKGLLPGLARSFIANGCSMVVYKRVLVLLEEGRRTD
jgi:hypothetical protein